MQTGERFPFASPSAQGFGLDESTCPRQRFAAGMEGVAYLERLGIERFEALGFKIGRPGLCDRRRCGRARRGCGSAASVNRRTYPVPGAA